MEFFRFTVICNGSTTFGTTNLDCAHTFAQNKANKVNHQVVIKDNNPKHTRAFNMMIIYPNNI